MKCADAFLNRKCAKKLSQASNIKCWTIVIVTEQHALKNVNNCLNSNIHSYLETSGGQSSNLYLSIVHFFNTSVN